MNRRGGVVGTRHYWDTQGKGEEGDESGKKSMKMKGRRNGKRTYEEVRKRRRGLRSYYSILSYIHCTHNNMFSGVSVEFLFFFLCGKGVKGCMEMNDIKH